MFACILQPQDEHERITIPQLNIPVKLVTPFQPTFSSIHPHFQSLGILVIFARPTMNAVVSHIQYEVRLISSLHSDVLGCNGTIQHPGMCGGLSSRISADSGCDGKELGQMYCLSGKHYLPLFCRYFPPNDSTSKGNALNTSGLWTCSPSPASPSPIIAQIYPRQELESNHPNESSGVPVGIIIGAVGGGISGLIGLVCMYFAVKAVIKASRDAKAIRKSFPAPTRRVYFGETPPPPSISKKKKEAEESKSPLLGERSVNAIASSSTPEEVELRLMELKEEAERGLAEIRAQREGKVLEGKGGNDVPPAYNAA